MKVKSLHHLKWAKSIQNFTSSDCSTWHWNGRQARKNPWSLLGTRQKINLIWTHSFQMSIFLMGIFTNDSKCSFLKAPKANKPKLHPNFGELVIFFPSSKTGHSIFIIATHVKKKCDLVLYMLLVLVLQPWFVDIFSRQHVFFSWPQRQTPMLREKAWMYEWQTF